MGTDNHDVTPSSPPEESSSPTQPATQSAAPVSEPEETGPKAPLPSQPAAAPAATGAKKKGKKEDEEPSWTKDAWGHAKKAEGQKKKGSDGTNAHVNAMSAGEQQFTQIAMEMASAQFKINSMLSGKVGRKLGHFAQERYNELRKGYNELTKPRELSPTEQAAMAEKVDAAARLIEDKEGGVELGSLTRSSVHALEEIEHEALDQHEEMDIDTSVDFEAIAEEAPQALENEVVGAGKEQESSSALDPLGQETVKLKPVGRMQLSGSHASTGSIKGDKSSTDVPSDGVDPTNVTPGV